MSGAEPNPGLRRLLGEARQRLVQTGTRNRLVHCVRLAKRGKFIDIVNENTDNVFGTLVRRRRMRFLHDERMEADGNGDDVHLELEVDVRSNDTSADLLLQTALSEDRLQKRLLAMAREAKTVEEEQGINVLYVALGFLRWFEDDKSEVVHQAPLILVPATLKRNTVTSLYELIYSGDDIVTNEPLKHRLNDDFGIKLPDIPDDEDWQPSGYFDDVRLAISGKSKWSVEPDGMQLGFFSFAKLLMVNDLEPANWPDEHILGNSLVRSLLAEGFGHEPDDFPPEEKLDTRFAPADLIQVVDADSSQTLVIESVRSGRSLVVQGPPGTGKSQTITNIIAAAAHDGRSVLFVAEKMAALNVVHERLKKAGLSHLCLELHSRQANKKAVLQELERTLAARSERPAMESDAAEGLREIRDRLNTIAGTMHRPIGNSGETAYRVLSTLITLQERDFPPPSVAIPQIENWTADHYVNAASAAEALARLVQSTGPKNAHPLHGLGDPGLLPMDLPRLKQQLEEFKQKLRRAAEMVSRVERALQVDGDVAEGLIKQVGAVLGHIASLPLASKPFAAAIAQNDRLEIAINIADAGLKHHEKARAVGSTYTDAALESPVRHVRLSLAAGLTFLGRWGGTYRRASAELASLVKGKLPKRPEDRIVLVDQLLDLQKSLAQLRNQHQTGIDFFGPLWLGEGTDFAALDSAARWLGDLSRISTLVRPAVAVSLRRHEPEELRILAARLGQMAEEVHDEAAAFVERLEVDLTEAFKVNDLAALGYEALADIVGRWANNLDRIDEWCRLIAADAALRQLGCTPVADAICSGAMSPEATADTMKYLRADALYRTFARAEPWIGRLTREDKLTLVRGFVEREKHRFASTAQLISCEHLDRMPRGGMGAMGIIRGEIAKRRGHKPIRKLMAEAGVVVQQIKPVMLMSPISVAQYLPPGKLEFDLLVIDEASQVRPEDALGAVARAKQIVVVGDTKQLPPTSFFDRMLGQAGDEDTDDDANDEPGVTAATELESVLTLCEARGLSSRMLKWHYRSRHPSLIEVSNQEFYGTDLILFPSPAATRETDGLVVRRVNGAYDRGGKRTNRIEAEAVVKAVARHARHSSDRSLGVVTFSTAQRDVISELLELARREDEELDAFLDEGRHEECFVKNLENVQGDERDVILVSVGYGPRIAGQRLDSMGFGPVSSDGGERRLNVLFTRARFRTEVFVSFDSADINLDRTLSVGARVLKRFLHYAETGKADDPRPLGDDPDSDFEVAVARAVRHMGYHADHQVGSGGFRIDIAVRHPSDSGRYMLAIECDGATYHSALWARERDRLRQEVLEGLGWRFHRIWSTDWFHRRQDEMRRLKEALESARDEVQRRPAPVTVEPEKMVGTIEDDAEPVGDPKNPTRLPPYVCASFPVPGYLEPHDVPLSTLAEIVAKVIDIEGPVHQDEVARRVGSLFSKQRTGSRIGRAVLSALRHLSAGDRAFRAEDGFWFTAGQEEAPPLRDRSLAPVPLRRAAMLPPLEISRAIVHVIRENGAVGRDELPRAVALLFGFQRTGQDFNATVSLVIDKMIGREILEVGHAGIALKRLNSGD